MKKFCFASQGIPTGTEFVGESWEEGGLRVDDEGNPTHDWNRNTVTNHSVTDLTEEDADLLADAFYGEDGVTSLEGLREWLAGLPEAVISATVAVAEARKREPVVDEQEGGGLSPYEAELAGLDAGAASVRIELDNGKLWAYHGGDGTLLLEVSGVKAGTWDALWAILENCGSVDMRVS